MNTSAKFSWAITTVSLIAVIAMAYMFIVRGAVTASDDGRSAIMLSAGERDLVLGEMRGFLESIQAIAAALATDDMAAVAASARAVGAGTIGAVPVTLMGKLPLEFKALGRSTHVAFDDLANEATDMGNSKVMLSKLGELMKKCTSCHAGYRFDIEQSAKQAD